MSATFLSNVFYFFHVFFTFLFLSERLLHLCCTQMDETDLDWFIVVTAGPCLIPQFAGRQRSKVRCVLARNTDAIIYVIIIIMNS